MITKKYIWRGRESFLGNENADRKNWMSLLNQEKKLTALSIPGTHNSGTKETGAGPAHCQNFSIKQQLEEGIRFLDIRVKKKENSLQVYHGICDCRIDLVQVLAWCQDFLSNNSGETILMSIKNEEKDQDISGNMRDILEKYESLFLKTNNVPVLAEARGKIVLFNRSSFSCFGINWTAWKDNATFELNTEYDRFYIEDTYKTFDTRVKIEKIKETLNRANIAEESAIFYVTFCSIAWGDPFFHPHTPYQNAWGGGGVNPPVNPTVNHFIQSCGSHTRLGLILLDFYNNHGEDQELVDNIIRANF